MEVGLQAFKVYCKILDERETERGYEPREMRERGRERERRGFERVGE